MIKMFIMAYVLMSATFSFALTPFFPVGKEGASTYYKNKVECESKEGQPCYDTTGKDVRFHEVQTSQVDDKTKPIYKAPYNSENCDSPQDCADKVLAKVSSCNNGDNAQYQKNEVLPGYTLFCTGITGYEQKTVSQLVENPALKASILATDAAKKTERDAIDARTKRIYFGVRMIAFMGVRNDSKNLTAEQSAQFLTTYAPVMQMLQAGAIDTAKAQIESLTPDGTITTEADKNAILAEINAYLGN